MSRAFLVHVPTSIKSTNWNQVNMHNKSEGMENIILLFQVYIRVKMYHSLLDANFTSSFNLMCLLLTCLNFCHTWSPFNLHLLCQNFTQLILMGLHAISRLVFTFLCLLLHIPSYSL